MRFLILLLCLCSFAVYAEEDELPKKTYQWHNFSLEYPMTFWTLEILENQAHTQNIKLTSKREQPLSIVLNLRDDMPIPDDKYYDNPAAVSSAFGLPIALKLADKHEERISVTFAQINFAEHWQLAAFFSVNNPENNIVQHIKAFHYFPETEHHGVLGAILSTTKKGELVNDKKYYDFLYQAYDILLSIKVKK